jgi:hypothetical protein
MPTCPKCGNKLGMWEWNDTICPKCSSILWVKNSSTLEIIAVNLVFFGVSYLVINLFNRFNWLEFSYFPLYVWLVFWIAFYIFTVVKIIPRLVKFEILKKSP